MSWEIAYLSALIVGMIGSRVSVVGARGGIEQRSIVFALIGALATFMTLSLIVWGLAALSWYWPIGGFVAGSILAAVIVTRSNWSAWFKITPILDIIAVAAGGYLWVWGWPF